MRGRIGGEGVCHQEGGGTGGRGYNGCCCRWRSWARSGRRSSRGLIGGVSGEGGVAIGKGNGGHGGAA